MTVHCTVQGVIPAYLQDLQQMSSQVLLAQDAQKPLGQGRACQDHHSQGSGLLWRHDHSLAQEGCDAESGKLIRSAGHHVCPRCADKSGNMTLGVL